MVLTSACSLDIPTSLSLCDPDSQCLNLPFHYSQNSRPHLSVGCLCLLSYLQDEFLRVIHDSCFSPPQFHTLDKLPRLFLHNCFLKFLGLFKDCSLFSSCHEFSSPCFKTTVLTSLLNDLPTLVSISSNPPTHLSVYLF